MKYENQFAYLAISVHYIASDEKRTHEMLPCLLKIFQKNKIKPTAEVLFFKNNSPERQFWYEHRTNKTHFNDFSESSVILFAYISI